MSSSLTAPAATVDDPPPINRVARALNRITSPGSAPRPILNAHRWLYERSDGRIGHGLIGAPTLLLKTTGRRSGKPRTSALVYARDGKNIVLVASNEGSNRPPAWLHNVRAHPDVEVQIGRRRLRGHAAAIDAANPDYARLWTLMNSTNHRRYDHYQSQTSRPIALVMIMPDHN
ncbi:MAG TPA: nitroreductase family deazaflavin-dependent oxidoreductase [Solirubrobacteraceae bacterium]|nr:nitroreductase family deazaflavin-dependent oxidoreductase [Solirubrobacteraceae bacterium]